MDALRWLDFKSWTNRVSGLDNRSSQKQSSLPTISFEVRAVSFREGNFSIFSIFKNPFSNHQKHQGLQQKKTPWTFKSVFYPKNPGDTSNPPTCKKIRVRWFPFCAFQGPLRSLNPHEPLPWDRLYQQAQAWLSVDFPGGALEFGEIISWRCGMWMNEPLRFLRGFFGGWSSNIF